jgi:hypothetical protein
MIGEDLIVQVGMQILSDSSVQATIHTVVIKGLTAVIAFITPYIIPALAVIGVVLLAAAVTLLTVKVAEWIMTEFA